VRIVASPGLLPDDLDPVALAPLARAGLLGDVVVDAKSGVSGAGREPKAEMMFSEVNESVKAYGVGGHRHVAEIEQELGCCAASRSNRSTSCPT
jgi:N-acetyl-gamma-glutamyl-phosphate reductase